MYVYISRFLFVIFFTVINIFSFNFVRYSDLIEKINILFVNGDCVELIFRYICRFFFFNV